MNPLHDKILLTPADCFMLALEKKHVRAVGLSNVCHYLLELEGKLNRDAFEQTVNARADLRWLASVSPVKKFWFSAPIWKKQNKAVAIPVYEQYTDELIPESVVNIIIDIDEPPLLRFDFLHRTNGNTAVVFSWHHLLMDGYGAVLLLRQLFNAQPLELTRPTENKKFSFEQLKAATRAKFFIDRTSRKPLSTVSPETLTKSNQKIHFIKFTEEETAQIDASGITLGARFGRSSLYLTASSRGVNSLLKNRNEKINDFWIPVPRDQRKKGAQGPLVGNHLSFLFYRLKTTSLNSLKETVQEVNSQMMDQIRTKTFSDYDTLMDFLRRTPLPLYYHWIKGPQGGSLSSFLFTVAADHPEDFTHFEKHKIIDSWSFPSNIYPPGLTFAFMRFHQQLHLMILYFDDVISAAELGNMERQMKHELIHGTLYHE